jgi:hypothetical protein
MIGFVKGLWQRPQPKIEELKKDEAVLKVVPMFYEIRDGQTNQTKGCLLGAYHDLKSIYLYTQREMDVDDLFGDSSKVRRCFDRSNVFASEVRMMNFVDLRSLMSGEERGRQLQSELESHAMDVVAVDFLFEMRALANRKDVRGLETLKERFDHQDRKATFKDSIRSWSFPAQCQRKETVYQAFLEGSEEKWQLMNEQCSQQEQQLLIERNRRMAQRADAILKDNKTDTAFITVGATHLPGKEGMCALLRERGYVLQRVFEDASQ